MLCDLLCLAICNLPLGPHLLTARQLAFAITVKHDKLLSCLLFSAIGNCPLLRHAVSLDHF